MKLTNCLKCNKGLISGQEKFCSNSCSNSYNNLGRKLAKKYKDMPCFRCGIIFNADFRSSFKTCCASCKDLASKEARLSFYIRKTGRVPKPFEVKPREQEISERFLPNIYKSSSSCWLWLGAKISTGYGEVTIQGKTWLAHRFSYLYHKSEDPGSFFVCHTCDIPHCVNPDHLWLGSPVDNVLDMCYKLRHSHKLTVADVKLIRSLALEGIKPSILAKRFFLHVTTIRSVINRKTWDWID